MVGQNLTKTKKDQNSCQHNIIDGYCNNMPANSAL